MKELYWCVFFYGVKHSRPLQQKSQPWWFQMPQTYIQLENWFTWGAFWKFWLKTLIKSRCFPIGIFGIYCNNNPAAPTCIHCLYFSVDLIFKRVDFFAWFLDRRNKVSWKLLKQSFIKSFKSLRDLIMIWLTGYLSLSQMTSDILYLSWQIPQAVFFYVVFCRLLYAFCFGFFMPWLFQDFLDL